MRSMILGMAAAVALAGAAAEAAPTCQSKTGDAIRCGTPGAMPVGWTLPPELQAPRDSAELDSEDVLSLMCLIGGLFALIAVMPDFDDHWDEQEEERRKRR